MRKSVKRLSAGLAPHHYDLQIIPDREARTFSGSVSIVGEKTDRPSQRLTFHQNGLDIISAKITHRGKKGTEQIVVDRINHHKGFDEVRLHTSKLVYPGNYHIELEFNGLITRNMNGIYPCYFEENGQKKELIATQFESHHAREVFPCIDEPEAKATFELTLTTPVGETVLSNTPVAKKKESEKFCTTTFEKTPKMSTYLLAFAYGEMSYKEAKTKTGTTIRTYATKQNVELTDFALDTAVKCLEFYENYFGIAFPLPKCDFVALPDFASGAMENWGLITFREQALLVDEENTSLSNKQYVAMVVAHELAHQWFGNLVTMRWWTDLWLNEGFASWIEYLAVDHMFPEWQMWTQFIVDEQQQALKLDALEYTHPVEVAVQHPDEIRTIFDAISYSKGASVIHMLHNYLGAKDFRLGLRYYLDKHAYSNTDTVDLWEALEETSGKPVKNFMHAWTSQSGFPVVEATVHEEENVVLSQKQFFINPSHSDHAAQTWPIALLTKSPDIPAVLESKSTKVKVKDSHELKLNRGQSGFYRVAYNPTHLKRLGELIKRGHLSAEDRLGLLNDSIESAKAGQTDTTEALAFLENFKDEANYAVWDSISAVIGSIRLVMGTDELREDMKPFVRNLVKPQLERLGWERKKSESHFDQLLRPIILGMAASADEPVVIKRCHELFNKTVHSEDVAPDLQVAPSKRHVKRGIDIDPDLRGTVFGTVARLGDSKTFDKLLRLHNEATLSEERVTLSAALTGFKQPAINKKALAVITTDDVRLQDAAYWIVYSFINRHARGLAWQWLQDQWPWLEENLGTDLAFYRMPVYAARAFSDHEFLKQYKAFFKPRLSPAFERSFNQGVETVEWQAAWKDRDYRKVKTFFENRS